MAPLIALLVLATPAHADWPAGALLDPAITADVTEPGLDAIADVVPALVPDKLDLDDMYTEGSLYRMWISDLWVGLQVADADLTPGNDVLALDTTLVVWLNDSASPANVEVEVYTFWWWTLADCDVWTDPFQVWVDADISLRVVDDGVNPPWLDATIGGVLWDWDIENDDVELDCWVGTLDDILDWVGLSPVEMVLESAESEIDGAIVDMVAELELTLEEAFASAIIDETVPLGDSELEVHLHPSTVRIRPAGVRIDLAGSLDAEPAPCIREYGISSSAQTPGEAPDLGSAPAGVPQPHHLGFFLDDDFVNQGLFAAWYGGVLCQDLSEEDGLPLNTALLGVLSPTYAELFPDTGPVQVVTRPAEPPLATPTGDFDLNFTVEGLGVDLMADVEHRRANVLGADIAVDTGADLVFDGATGTLDVRVALAAEDLSTTIRFNELAPGEDEALAEAFSGLFDALVEPLVAPMLEDLSFALPAFEGVGFTRLTTATSGSSGDHFGFFGEIGPVTYGADGTGCGGCGESTGDGGCGCASGASPAAWVALVALAGAVLRRRRS